MTRDELMVRIGQVARWIVIAAAVSVAVLYAGDYVSVRYRMAHKTVTDPIESTQVRPLYAVPRKDGKDEFDFGDTETQTCVHSLFPHFGYSPCWYMKREDQEPIPISSAPWSAPPNFR